jgi:hypothetical protein
MKIKKITWNVQENYLMKFYSNNIQKHEYEMKWTSLWCKIMPSINLKHILDNVGSNLYLYPFEDLAQISFHMFIIQITFLKTFINYKLTIGHGWKIQNDG